MKPSPIIGPQHSMLASDPVLLVLVLFPNPESTLVLSVNMRIPRKSGGLANASDSLSGPSTNGVPPRGDSALGKNEMRERAVSFSAFRCRTGSFFNGG